MENASNALIMAAAILIGILILSLGVYLAHIISGYVEITQNQMAQTSIKQFNDKFLQYDALLVTMQDIITVKNYAIENNNQGEGYGDVDVLLKRTSDVSAKTILGLTDSDLLTNEIEEIGSTKEPKRFKCTVEINNDTGRVCKVTFEET